MQPTFEGRVKKEETEIKTLHERFLQEEGAIGYIFLWALGVPASLLFVIFPYARLHIRRPDMWDGTDEGARRRSKSWRYGVVKERNIR